MEGRISIAMNVYKDICTIHKPGGASIQKDILFQYFNNIITFEFYNNKANRSMFD